MDALEFLRERKRMCKSYVRCIGCPLERGRCGLIASMSDEEFEKIIATVEQWPETILDELGEITICPAAFSCDYRSSDGGCKHPGVACCDCRREFWMQEVE